MKHRIRKGGRGRQKNFKRDIYFGGPVSLGKHFINMEINFQKKKGKRTKKKGEKDILQLCRGRVTTLKLTYTIYGAENKIKGSLYDCGGGGG